MLAEDPELVRDGGDGSAQDVRQVTHAQLRLAREEIKDVEATRAEEEEVLADAIQPSATPEIALVGLDPDGSYGGADAVEADVLDPATAPERICHGIVFEYLFTYTVAPSSGPSRHPSVDTRCPGETENPGWSATDAVLSIVELSGTLHVRGRFAKAKARRDGHAELLGLSEEGHLLDAGGPFQGPGGSRHTAHSEEIATTRQSLHRQCQGAYVRLERRTDEARILRRGRGLRMRCAGASCKGQRRAARTDHRAAGERKHCNRDPDATFAHLCSPPAFQCEQQPLFSTLRPSISSS